MHSEYLWLFSDGKEEEDDENGIPSLLFDGVTCDWTRDQLPFTFIHVSRPQLEPRLLLLFYSLLYEQSYIATHITTTTMDSAITPPLTPIRTYMSPTHTSPTRTSYREHLRRRTSSFSSNHDRSPVTPKSRHRHSNASQLSADFGPHVDDEGGGGLGNLADELDQLDDEEDDDYDEGVTEDIPHCEGEEQSRDSGIDVSYAHSENGQPKDASRHVRNFSKPFKDGPTRNEDGEDEMFSKDLEGLMADIARMTSSTSASEDPLIPRMMAQLQDLGNQSSLEAAAQRLTTSTNSLSSHLNTQAKVLQTLAQSLVPLFSFATLDPALVEEMTPVMEALAKDIPQPDMQPVQMLQRLDRETTDVAHALSGLTDTIQMGKQITNSAARSLRTTQDMVVDLRTVRERADLAQHSLSKSDWPDKIKDRWCGAECKDIISGFEDRCMDLRRELEAAGA